MYGEQAPLLFFFFFFLGGGGGGGKLMNFESRISQCELAWTNFHANSEIFSNIFLIT